MESEFLTVPMNKIITDGEWAAPKKMVATIRRVGQLYPLLVVREGARGWYRIVGGRRRHAALKALGRSTVEVKVLPEAALLEGMEGGVARDAVLASLALAEQVHSRNPLSEARALRVLMEDGQDGDDFLLQISGLSSTQRTKLLKLLSLRLEYQKMVEQGRLSITAALELVRLPRKDQRVAWGKALEMAKREGRPSATNVRRAVRKVRAEQQPPLPAPPPPPMDGKYDVDLIAVAAWLRQFAVLLPDPDHRVTLRTASLALEEIEKGKENVTGED